MAIRYVCDRCHAQRDNEDFLLSITLPAAGVLAAGKTFQLCPHCVQHLHGEAAPLPIAAPERAQREVGK